MIQIKIKILKGYLTLNAEYNEADKCYYVVNGDTLRDAICVCISVPSDFLTSTNKSHRYNLARYMYVYLAHKLGESIRDISLRLDITNRTAYYWQQEGYSHYVHNNNFKAHCNKILCSIKKQNQAPD